MKIAIIGASGFVGSALLEEAKRRDHTITAISRHPDDIEAGEEVETVGVDVNNVDKLAAALRGHRAVLSAFNAGWDNPNLYEDYMEGAQHIQEAAKQAGVDRLLVVGGAGSLEVQPGRQLVDTPDFPDEYREGAEAARDYLEILRGEEELNWTFLSPAIRMNPETEHQRTGQYRLGRNKPIFNEEGQSIISVEDLSVALLDELEEARFMNQRFTAGY